MSTLKPVDTGGFQVRPVRHEKDRHERETGRPDDDADTESKQLMSLMGYEFMSAGTSALKGHPQGHKGIAVWRENSRTAATVNQSGQVSKSRKSPKCCMRYHRPTRA